MLQEKIDQLNHEIKENEQMIVDLREQNNKKRRQIRSLESLAKKVDAVLEGNDPTEAVEEVEERNEL